MQKRIVRFIVPDPRREKDVAPVEHLLCMLYDEDGLAWCSIDNLLTHVNNNTWELSRQFGIHVAHVVAVQRRLCSEGYCPLYSVREYIWKRMTEEANDGGPTMPTLQNDEHAGHEEAAEGVFLRPLRPDRSR